MVLGGEVYHGRAAVRRELLTSELLTDRYCQRLIKNAMYRAALASGVHRPAWGALTGVRPGKIFCSLLVAGLSEDEATRRFRASFVREDMDRPPRGECGFAR